MYKTKKIIAFIGARGGSKGLKNKNIIDLAGKPLIGWTIEASLGSKYVDRTIVSTDSEQIAQVAKKSGAEAPFLRPKEFATDESLLDEAIQHCMEWLKNMENITYDYLVLLQPTSPLRTSRHIDEAIEYFFEHQKSDKDMLISVTPVPLKTGWLMHSNESGYIQFSLDITRGKRRRQEMPQFYLPNGFIYFGAQEIMQKISKVNDTMIPYIVDEEVAADIDSKDDLEKALAWMDKNIKAYRETE